MDRDRLKEVHTTDLTESRVNEDFVDWLKNKGPTWLLVILVAVCAYLFIVRWKQGKVEHTSEAWRALFEAATPGSYEDVATEYPDVGQLANVARLQAARDLLRSVQMGLALGAVPPPVDPNNPVPPVVPPAEILGDAQRGEYLDRASRLYQAIIDSDDGSEGLTLIGVNARNGMAVVAECRGDAEAARDWYVKAEERAGTYFPELAAQAEERAASAGEFLQPVTLLPQAQITTDERRAPPPVGIFIDEALRPYLMPDESGG